MSNRKKCGHGCDHDHDMEVGGKQKRERDAESDEEEEEEEQGFSKVDMAKEHLKENPQCVRKRLRALENLQKQHQVIDAAYREELDALERRYMERHAPLLARRTAIVAGEVEATDADAEGYVADPTAPNTDVKGVPLFWYHALVNNEAIRELTGLNDRDKEALAALRDVRYAMLPRTKDVVEGKEITRHGFTLLFTFADNEFFAERELSKTYHLTEDETGEPMFDRSEAVKPTWKAGKNLTVRVIKKAVPRPKRGGKRGGASGPQFQTVEEPCESFFQFFSPAQMPDAGAEMDPDEFEELSQAVQADFEAGCELRDSLCPRAVMWYNGDAVEEDDDEEDWDDEEGEEGEFDEDEEGDDEDEDEDDEEERPKPKKGGAAQPHKFAPPPGTQPAENPECKQQ